MTRALLLVFTIACIASGACSRRSTAADDVDVRVTLRPNAPAVGVAAVVEITLQDARGRVIPDADLRIEAHMAHPGMAPVLGRGTRRADGVHEVPLQFTMAGDWVLHISGTLADGRRLDRWIDVRDVREADGT